MATTTPQKAEQKYPHSANLFQFCRSVLDRKFGGIRVIDQDVGQILGFDPADCSHWKKGKKNIKSIQAMKKIADHLGVDESLVIDVAAGEITNSEALFEVDGYGNFSLDHKTVDKAKKEYYKTNAHQWSQHKDQHIHSVLSHNNQLIDDIVMAIHDKIQFREAPLYLPEIVTCYPKLTLKPIEPLRDVSLEHDLTGSTSSGTDSSDQGGSGEGGSARGTAAKGAAAKGATARGATARGATAKTARGAAAKGTAARGAAAKGATARGAGGQEPAMPIPNSMGTGLVVTSPASNQGLVVSYPFDNNMRPFLRFQIAKAFSQYFFQNTKLADLSGFGPIAAQIQNIQANLFAAKLLTPAHMVKNELRGVHISKDIIAQLAEIFWVSKIFMNIRLKDITVYSPRI